MTALSDYRRIEQAINYIHQNRTRQPNLAEVASAINLSEAHCQRLFSRYAGISPKRFLQFLTLEHAKTLLAGSTSIMDASLTAGLSGPSRLHDHFVTLEGVTPGEFKGRGAGMEITYGVAETLFGWAFMAKTRKGVCRLQFMAAPGEQRWALAELQRLWPQVRMEQSDLMARELAEMFIPDAGIGATARHSPLRLQVFGTNLQVRVWQALLAIPSGGVVTYSDIAGRVGNPAAVRAVANAIGANPVAYLIPCHRVLRKNAGLGGYRWGVARKQAMLAWESARNLETE